ncbi:hypothetical protein ACJJIX_00045 [Microbulbifer sp. VAAC004]|uniref:hypothetical protein n=1 Tax=unclassified Microbulbifer TaxID=2619833 RepID=UPI00403A0D09
MVIAENTPPILQLLGVSSKHRLYLNRNFESCFKDLAGSVETVRQACTRLNKHWAHGLRDYQQFLSPNLSQLEASQSYAPTSTPPEY